MLRVPGASARSKTTSNTRTSGASNDRKARLLKAGEEIFATQRYEDVAVSDIADRAGVAHGLLFHYFGSKRQFYFAVLDDTTRGSEREFDANTTEDPARWLRKEIDTFLDQITHEAPVFSMIVRGSLGAEEEVRRIFDRERDAAVRRLLTKLAPERSSELLEMTLVAWVSAANELGIQWIERGTPSKARVRSVLIAMLNGALRSVADVDRRARFDAERFAGA